jgi:hypothetical protein
VFDTIVVVLIVALALVIVGRFLYRNLTGKSASCGACPTGCGSCAPKDARAGDDAGSSRTNPQA